MQRKLIISCVQSQTSLNSPRPTPKGADEAGGDDYELCVTVNNAPGIAHLAFLAVSLAATVISCVYCKRISRSGNRKKKERLLKS